MPRLARIVVPGLPHHVTQKGNRGADIFVDAGDRRLYLSLLNKYARRHRLDILAYCLMTNHVHLVVVPTTELSLAHGLRDAHTAYDALWFNRRAGVSGHLWQGRFFSCPLDEAHLVAAVRYVERNPVRARLVSSAQEYAWSSAAAHCGLREDPLLSQAFPPPAMVADWPAWLSWDDDLVTETIRQHTHTGRPCGSASFVAELLGGQTTNHHPGAEIGG